MVPWHPPCALISLIFSSLDPETNCCYIEIYKSFDSPLLRFATGLHIESLLCSCQGAGSSCRQAGTAFRFCFQTLKTIQTETHFTTASDATLCVLLTFLVGIQLAQQLCCHALSNLFVGSYGRLMFNRIDHRMNPPCFHFGLLLRKEVIQPHLPIRLPCYDFTPVIGLALDG